MKRCPTCNRIYNDDGLSFCLEDGILLVSTGGTASGPAQAAGFDPNATLQFDSVRDTNPPATQILSPDQIPAMPYVPPVVNTAPPNTYNAPQSGGYVPPVINTPPPNTYNAPQPGGYAPPVINTPPVVTPPVIDTTPPVVTPKKSGLPWLVIGGAVIGVLLIGVIGIIGLAAYLSDDNKNGNTNKTSNTNGAQTTASPASGGKEAVNPPATAGTFTDDFATPRWPTGEAAQGSMYSNGSYVMNFSDPNRFAVVYAPANDANYSTDNVQSVKVEVTNLDGNAPQIGYGLVVNGSVVNGNLLNGYAFLIESKSGQCLIAQLKNSVQSTVTAARPAPTLKKGTATNVLEVRTNGSKLEFYVNGQMSASMDNKATAPGRVGFYTSSGGPVAFDNLAIVRDGGGKSWNLNK